MHRYTGKGFLFQINNKDNMNKDDFEFIKMNLLGLKEGHANIWHS